MPATIAGLAIALLGIPVVVSIYRVIVPVTASASQLLARETAILALVAILIAIVIKGERLPLQSIGVQRGGVGRTLLWALAGFAALGVATAVALGALKLLGLSYGSGGPKFAAPLWATLLIVIRAGVAEEVFYRGYAIERIEALTGNKWIAAIVPLLFFAAFHFNSGWGGILIALILGAVLTAFYMWKRNLVANILAHFLIDFVPNILLPLIAG